MQITIARANYWLINTFFVQFLAKYCYDPKTIFLLYINIIHKLTHFDIHIITSSIYSFSDV